MTPVKWSIPARLMSNRRYEKTFYSIGGLYEVNICEGDDGGAFASVYRRDAGQYTIEIWRGKATNVFASPDNGKETSVLIEIEDPVHYMCICGSYILNFAANSQIVQYSGSPNYAIDIDNNIYLISEKVIMESNNRRTEIPSNPSQYYDNRRYILETVRRYMWIKRFFIENEPVDFEYDPDPDRYYDDLTASGAKKLYIELAEGDSVRKTELTKDGYTYVLRSYGARMGFQLLELWWTFLLP